MKRKIYIKPNIRTVYCEMENLLNPPSGWIEDDDDTGGGFEYDDDEGDGDDFGGGK